MSIENALASVAVKDFETAVVWYEQLLEKPADSRVSPGIAEWKFRLGGSLQVYQLPERAGSGSFTLAVTNIDALTGHVEQLGINTSERKSIGKMRTLMITDPDGNHIAFTESVDRESGH